MATTPRVTLLPFARPSELTQPTDVQRAMEIAFKYRNYFRKDIIVDLIVYRRWWARPRSYPCRTRLTHS